MLKLKTQDLGGSNLGSAPLCDLKGRLAFLVKLRRPRPSCGTAAMAETGGSPALHCGSNVNDPSVCSMHVSHDGGAMLILASFAL